MMQRCCQAAVEQLGAAFARVWPFDSPTQVLVLAVSAGLYPHLYGPHGRVPVGQFKQPHFTNQVVGDPRVSDQTWAAREGMVAIAGYPSIVADELVGVMAMFTRTPLAPDDLLALETASTATAVAITSTSRLEEAQRERNAAALTLQDSQRAREEAEAANRAKEEFLGTMSHELRTPLNAIGGYAGLLSMGVRGPVTPDQVEYLDRITRAGRQLQSLINDILNYARLDAGEVHYDVEDVNALDAPCATPNCSSLRRCS